MSKSKKSVKNEERVMKNMAEGSRRHLVLAVELLEVTELLNARGNT
jgi:hypothetical protein